MRMIFFWRLLTVLTQKNFLIEHKWKMFDFAQNDRAIAIKSTICSPPAIIISLIVPRNEQKRTTASSNRWSNTEQLVRAKEQRNIDWTPIHFLCICVRIPKPRRNALFRRFFFFHYYCWAAISPSRLNQFFKGIWIDCKIGILMISNEKMAQMESIRSFRFRILRILVNGSSVFQVNQLNWY